MSKQIIEVGKEKKPAAVICPYCKQEILIDIRPFSDDVSNIMRDNCPKCSGEIFVGVMILCHPQLPGILACIQKVIEALNPGNINLISK